MRRLLPLALVAALAMPASVAGQGFAIEGHVDACVHVAHAAFAELSIYAIATVEDLAD